MFAATEGTATIRTESSRFVNAFAHRVEAGLLTGRPHSRSHYAVVRSGKDHLGFIATDWQTAVSVGLNEVDLTFPTRGSVAYQIRFRRWGRFVVGLGALIGCVLAGLLLFARDAVVPSAARFADTVIPWSMVAFWGFAWPWILIALHKRTLRSLMHRLIAEVDAAAASTRGA